MAVNVILCVFSFYKKKSFWLCQQRCFIFSTTWCTVSMIQEIITSTVDLMYSVICSYLTCLTSSAGKAGELIDRGDNTYGGKFVVNPSGGLISKGHPLGATGTLNLSPTFFSDLIFLLIFWQSIQVSPFHMIYIKGKKPNKRPVSHKPKTACTSPYISSSLMIKRTFRQCFHLDYRWIYIYKNMWRVM